MSVMKSKDGKELIVTCNCGCEDSIHIRAVKDPWELGQDEFAFMTYMNGNWSRDQYTVFDVIKLKLKKIWRIIRGKDNHYSDIMMTLPDFEEFKQYINEV